MWNNKANLHQTTHGWERLYQMQSISLQTHSLELCYFYHSNDHGIVHILNDEVRAGQREVVVVGYNKCTCGAKEQLQTPLKNNGVYKSLATLSQSNLRNNFT